jgi:hypothetical protein
MPRFEITAPDGRKFEITAPEGASQAEVLAYAQANYQAIPQAPKESTIGSELVRGGKQLVSSARTGIGSIFNPEEAAKAGVARSEAIGAEAGVGPSLEAVKNAYQKDGVLSAAGEAASQIPRALAGQGANLASMYAASKAGAAAGSPFGARGRLIGGAAGAAGSLLPQFMGSNVERQASEQMDEGKDVSIDRTKAYTAAAGQAALESAGTAFVFGKRVVKGILGVADDAALATAKSQAELVKAAERSLAATAGRGALRGTAEMPVEVAQQVLERYQAGLDVTSADAIKEYGESAYQAALIGGPLGAAGNVVGRGQARDQVEQQKRAEAASRVPPKPEPEVVPGAKIPEEAPVGTQGTLFTPKEMGKKVAPPKEEPAPAEPAEEKQGEQLTLGIDFQRDYIDLFKERDRLREGEQTPEAKARIAELTEQLKSYDEADIGQRQAEKTIKEEKRTKEAEQKTADEAAAQRFPGLAGPTTATITQADIDAMGLPLRTSKQWITDNVLGKTVEEIKALVAREPKLISGKGARADVLKTLIAPEPKAFEEKPSDTTTTQTDQPQGELDLGGGEPSVGVPSEPAPTDVVQPGAGVPATTGAPATPDGLGLAPAGQPASTGTTTQGTQPAAVTANRTADQIQTEIRTLEDDRQKLLTKAGRIPAIKSPARTKWDTLSDQITQKKAEWDSLDKVERKAKTPNAPAAVTPTPSPAAPAAPVAGPKKADKPAPAPTVAKEDKAPPATKAAEPVKNQHTRLQDIIDNESLPAATRKQAEKNMDLLDDRSMNASAADRKGNEDYVSKFLTRVEGLKSVAIAEGQSLNNLKDEVKNAKGVLGTALRRMVESGKVVLEDAHPSGKKIGGIYDGEKVTLYANGIPSGQSMAVALHEVGAHLGMEKLLGKKQYNAVIDRILDMVAKGDGSTEAKMAQAAYKRIPVSDFKRGVGRDEMVAYFVEEMAKSEAAGTLPKIGPMRVMWNQIKTAIVTSINKALGTNFGVKDFSAQDILDIAKSSFVAESETAPTKGEAKEMFSVSYGAESLIDTLGPLNKDERSVLTKWVDQAKSEPDIGYVTKFRTQVADIAATIEKRLTDKFDGAVRNDMGKLNPMGLYRQAQDYTKMLLEYFQTGTLYKDTATGLWMSGQGKGVRPPVEVYELLKKYAEKNGYSQDRATQIASRVLEGVRLNEMRKSNNAGMTNFRLHLKDPEIDLLMREYNADPDLKEMNKLMDEARVAMVENMVQVGRLSKEQGDEWKSVVGYVPFDRIEDFATNFNKAKKISGKGLAQLGKLPELIGSDVRPVGNVFDNYINTLGWMVGQTMKTDATVQTLRSLEDAGFAKELGNTALGHANVVGAYVDGEIVYWSVPSKYDVMAFKDLNPPKAGWLRNMGAFSNILRKTVTVLPPFALKQVTDDVQRAILTSGVKNPGALIWMSLTNFPKLAFAELRGIQHPMVKEFGRLGLTGEYDFEAGKPATSLLKDLGYKKRGKFETLIHRLDGITRASDLAVRKAIYDQTMNESNDALLAQTRAREFINFRRRGSSDFVGAMVTTIPFFNAYIQGMDVLYRAASGKDSSSSVDRAQARRLFWSRASTVFMLSSLYALGMDDEDEDYNEMDLRTRDGNWILPGGYKLPVPGELGALFKVIPERIVEYMKRQGTPEEQTAFEAVRTTLTYMFEQYVGRAVPVPQAIKPVMEAWANKSFLTGRDLEGYHHKAMDPSARVNEQTSELAKAIAKFSRDQIGVEVSPIMIDNTLRGYFGSSAAMLTMVTDSLLNPTRVDRPLHKYALLSNYLYDPVGTRRMTEFYEQREKVGKANTTLNELMKTDLVRAEKYAEEHADELMLEGAVNSTLEQLERTRAYRKFLNSAEGASQMSKEDREAELKEVKQMEMEFAKWVREAQTELRKVQ